MKLHNHLAGVLGQIRDGFVRAPPKTGGHSLRVLTSARCPLGVGSLLLALTTNSFSNAVGFTYAEAIPEIFLHLVESLAQST